jgi:hypothetical protein
MAVLVEGLSVICRMDAIHKKFYGGWTAFEAIVPNSTLCCDSELARVGFMDPSDVAAFVDRLKQLGLEDMRNGECTDIATVDQLHGVQGKCPWLQFGRAPMKVAKDHDVSMCRLVGSEIKSGVFPNGWRFEGSLSQTGQFSPAEAISETLQFLRSEERVDVYKNSKTGQEVYIGRTAEGRRRQQQAAHPQKITDGGASPPLINSAGMPDPAKDHGEFVRLWKAGKLRIQVNRQLAWQVANSGVLPTGLDVAHVARTWLWALSIAGSFVLMFPYWWWVGLGCIVFLSPILFRATRTAVLRGVIRYAVENGDFYVTALKSQLITLEWRT